MAQKRKEKKQKQDTTHAADSSPHFGPSHWWPIVPAWFPCGTTLLRPCSLDVMSAYYIPQEEEKLKAEQLQKEADEQQVAMGRREAKPEAKWKKEASDDEEEITQEDLEKWKELHGAAPTTWILAFCIILSNMTCLGWETITVFMLVTSIVLTGRRGEA